MSCTIFTRFSKSNSFSLKGTKVLGDQEIRQSLSRTYEDPPEGNVSRKILKYKGATDAPAWLDIEEGKALCLPWYFVKLLRAKNR